jgi:hypothetical protein
MLEDFKLYKLTMCFLYFDQALSQYKKVKIEAVTMKSTGSHLRALQPSSDLENMVLPQLRQIQQQLRTDLEKVEQVCLLTLLCSQNGVMSVYTIKSMPS